MTWFKSDDKLPDHRKVRRAGTAAMGLWVLAGCWSSDNLTDGFVPRVIARRWDPRGIYATKLVKSELWFDATSDGEAGYQFVNWSEWNPTKAEVEAERERARSRMKKARLRRTGGERSDDVRPNEQGTSGEVPLPRPDPSRPVPTRPSSSEDLGGGVTEAGASVPPPPKCPKHINEPHPPNCGPCGDARRARADWDKAQGRLVLDQAKSKRAAINDCGDCDEAGWLIGSEPVIRCEHRQRRLS